MPFYEYPRAAITADIVLVAGVGEERSVLLVERGAEPYKGMWALPGGFVDENERPVDAARRELLEETGVAFGGSLLQVGAFGDPGRDPRGWTVSIAWVASIPDRLEAHGSDDASDARWFALGERPHLAFDHDLILERALGVLGSGVSP